MTAQLKWIDYPHAGGSQTAASDFPALKDAALLDAYSATVVGMAELVSPVTIKNGSASRRRSACCAAPKSWTSPSRRWKWRRTEAGVSV